MATSALSTAFPLKTAGHSPLDGRLAGTTSAKTSAATQPLYPGQIYYDTETKTYSKFDTTEVVGTGDDVTTFIFTVVSGEITDAPAESFEAPMTYKAVDATNTTYFRYIARDTSDDKVKVLLGHTPLVVDTNLSGSITFVELIGWTDFAEQGQPGVDGVDGVDGVGDDRPLEIADLALVDTTSSSLFGTTDFSSITSTNKAKYKSTTALGRLASGTSIDALEDLTVTELLLLMLNVQYELSSPSLTNPSIGVTMTNPADGRVGDNIGAGTIVIGNLNYGRVIGNRDNTGTSVADSDAYTKFKTKTDTDAATEPVNTAEGTISALRITVVGTRQGSWTGWGVANPNPTFTYEDVPIGTTQVWGATNKSGITFVDTTTVLQFTDPEDSVFDSDGTAVTDLLATTQDFGNAIWNGKEFTTNGFYPMFEVSLTTAINEPSTSYPSTETRDVGGDGVFTSRTVYKDGGRLKGEFNVVGRVIKWPKTLSAGTLYLIPTPGALQLGELYGKNFAGNVESSDGNNNDSGDGWRVISLDALTLANVDSGIARVDSIDIVNASDTQKTATVSLSLGTGTDADYVITNKANYTLVQFFNAAIGPGAQIFFEYS